MPDVPWRHLVDALPSRVNLLAVSKGKPASEIRALAELGQLDFGESRLQEALPKLHSLRDLLNLRWHFIGHLQSNKVRAVVRSFSWIHSVDSLPLAERISRISGEEGCSPQIMLQVKFRKDFNKGGFDPTLLGRLWPELRKLPNITIIGLMTMAPKNLDLLDRQNLFRDCRELANQLGLADCSMGMSQDWEQAVEAGATWVRLGSAVFGATL